MISYTFNSSSQDVEVGGAQDPGNHGGSVSKENHYIALRACFLVFKE